jgi:hypothetical protein
MGVNRLFLSPKVDAHGGTVSVEQIEEGNRYFCIPRVILVFVYNLNLLYSNLATFVINSFQTRPPNGKDQLVTPYEIQ